jgi:MSHA biogenesis protein MshJ
MKKYWLQFVEWFEARNERERILIIAVSVVALISLWTLLISDPQRQQRQLLETQFTNMQKQQMALQAQIDAIKSRARKDPNISNQQAISRLLQEVEAINTDLQEKMKGFVDPSRMATLLEEVLQKNAHLKLVRLESLPAEYVLADTKQVKESKNTSQAGLYQHAFRMELQGSYLDTLEYLKTLEALPWDFYWDAIDVEMKKYPQARIVLQLHTLSLKEGWIGV